MDNVSFHMKVSSFHDDVVWEGWWRKMEMKIGFEKDGKFLDLFGNAPIVKSFHFLSFQPVDQTTVPFLEK